MAALVQGVIGLGWGCMDMECCEGRIQRNVVQRRELAVHLLHGQLVETQQRPPAHGIGAVRHGFHQGPKPNISGMHCHDSICFGSACVPMCWVLWIRSVVLHNKLCCVVLWVCLSSMLAVTKGEFCLECEHCSVCCVQLNGLF